MTNEKCRLSESNTFNLYGSTQSLASKHKGCIPYRLVVTFIIMLGIMCAYSMRINLSIAMVAMVKSKVTCVKDNSSSNNTVCEDKKEFDWDQKTQGLILGAFFWGYIIPQVLGGWLFDKYGPKWIFAASLFLDGVFTILTPHAAWAGRGAIIACRVLIGFFQATTVSFLHAVLKKWAPPVERSRLAFLAFTGGTIGLILTLNLSSYLCEQGFAGGWPSVFYVVGGYSILWVFVFCIFVHNTPDESPFISEEEKLYIRNSMGLSAEVTKPLPMPWSHVLRSRGVWAIIVAHATQNWGFYMLLTELPKYMSEILKFEMKSNGPWSSLTYVSTWVIGFIISNIADYYIKTGKLKVVTVRKLCNSVGMFVPALGMYLITLCHSDTSLVIAILIIGSGFNGGIYSGHNCNHLDISSNFAATLIGMSNTVATIPGIIAPYVVGVFTNDDNTEGQWNKIFWISGSIWIIGGIFFIIFAAGEKQYWDNPLNQNVETTLERVDHLDNTSGPGLTNTGFEEEFGPTLRKDSVKYD